jgi:iron complex transport system substrate-binding protein
MIKFPKNYCVKFEIALLSAIFLLTYCNNVQKTKGLRIVSLSPAMTEILFALGAKNNIVGVTTFCDYPEEAKTIYKVGDFSHPSVERIVGLKPNLVVVNLPEQMKIKQNLEKLKINIFISSPKSLEDICNEIIEIGKILNKENLADSLVSYMKSNIKNIKVKRKKRMYIELSPRPIVTVGSKTFLNELIAMAGAENIFSDLDKEYPVVSQEEVIKRNPEIIIILHPEEIEDRIGWSKIEAIKKRRVIKELNQDYLLRYGPRLVEGFKALRKVIDE